LTPEETFKSFEAAQGRAGYDVDYMLDKFGQHRSRPMSDEYDAGLLSDDGGGDVEWWQDYLRAEIGRANDFHADLYEQLEAENARLKTVLDEAFQMLGTADLWPADMIVTVKRAMEIIADQRARR